MGAIPAASPPRSCASWPGRAMPTTTGWPSSRRRPGPTSPSSSPRPTTRSGPRSRARRARISTCSRSIPRELQRYIDAGLAAPHDLAKLPNQQHTLPQFRDLAQVRGVSADGKVYGIPFAFDSIGLIYDTTKVNPPPDSMNVLLGSGIQGQDPALRRQRPQFLVRRAGRRDRESVRSHRRAAAGDQGKADRHCRRTRLATTNRPTRRCRSTTATTWR